MENAWTLLTDLPNPYQPFSHSFFPNLKISPLSLQPLPTACVWWMTEASLLLAEVEKPSPAKPGCVGRGDKQLPRPLLSKGRSCEELQERFLPLQVSVVGSRLQFDVARHTRVLLRGWELQMPPWGIKRRLSATPRSPPSND